MKKIYRDFMVIGLVAVVSTFLVWLPFILGLGNRLLTVFANYDGPNYIVVAKTLYDKQLIGSSFSLPTPLEYYPAHLPAYPILIKLFNTVLGGPWAMLASTLLTTILASFMFYLLVRKLKITENPLWLSIVFLFLPARWLVVRSVGSPEPLFIFAVIASLYFFIDRKYWLAGIFGAIAFVTKTPGILLFVSYLILLIYNFFKTKKIDFGTYPLLLIPLSIIPVFLLYKFQTGDFLAYFHSGDNFHLVFPPFQSLITGRAWLGNDFWLEDMIYVYLFGTLSVIYLFKQKLYELATFALVFFTATLFISHRDLSRYSLPLMPLALIAFAPLLEKKEFKVAFVFVLLPIYIYAVNFIFYNTAPIADWAPYL